MTNTQKEVAIIIGLPVAVFLASFGIAVAISQPPTVECQALQNDIELQGVAIAQCTQGACVINASDLIAVRRDFARYLKHCTVEAELTQKNPFTEEEGDNDF